MAALEALGQLGPRVKDAAGKVVAGCMLDRNTVVGRKAKSALERIDPAVAEECTTIIVDKEHRVRSIETLGKLGRDARSATPVLIWVVESRAAGPNPRRPFEAAAAAIRALVLVAPDDVRLPARFVRWMGGPDEDESLAAVAGFSGLEKVGKQNMREGVLRLAKIVTAAPSPRVRAAAADALGEFGAEAAAAERALEAATADSNEDVRHSASRALRKVRGGAEGLQEP
jgi:hypothetical protein